MQSLGRQHNGAFRSRGSRRRYGAGASRYAPWLVLALAVAYGAGLRAEAQQTASWEARRGTEDISPRSGLTGDLQSATVIVNGDELFPVVGIPSFPARWRAREIAARIEALARDPAYEVKSLVAVDHEFGHAVLPAPGQEAVMVITPEDTRVIGIAGAVVADVYKKAESRTSSKPTATNAHRLCW